MVMKLYKQYTRTVILSALLSLSLKLLSQNDLLAYEPTGTCSNYINITGSTNVNRFEFRLAFPLHQVFSVDPSDLKDQYNQDMYKIYLPAKSFKADNQLILRDFLTLIKADLHPDIIIGVGYSQLLDFHLGNNPEIQYVRITLAGVTKVYPVAFLADVCSDNLVYVRGHKNIRLTDFGIQPPEKFLGLVKVENEVLINFGFVFMFGSEI
jgi:hypothetical protein